VFRIEGGSPEHRDEFYSRWLNIGNIKDTKIRECAYNLLTGEWQDIVTQRQTLRQQTTDTTTIQTVKIPNLNKNYIGQEYVMQNGLKVLIRQGDLVNENTEVIVNPANSELNHGDGAARAISAVAGPILDKKCRIYRNRFGDLQVGQRVHTTAGNMRPRIKYVLHAVGPHSGQATRQECFTLVQSTILQCLEYTENILEFKSLSIPAISTGLFGVPRVDVAQAMYQAILKFDQTRPNHVKEVRIVNIELETTTVIYKEFKWWFGQAPHMSDQCQAQLEINDIDVPLLFIHHYGEDDQINQEVTNIAESTNEDILVVSKKKKDYVPEKFTHFWRKESRSVNTSIVRLRSMGRTTRVPNSG